MENQTIQPGYSPAGFMREEIAQTLDTLTDMVLDYLAIDDLTPEAKEDACLCFRRVRDLLRADEAQIAEETEQASKVAQYERELADLDAQIKTETERLEQMKADYLTPKQPKA